MFLGNDVIVASYDYICSSCQRIDGKYYRFTSYSVSSCNFCNSLVEVSNVFDIIEEEWKEEEKEKIDTFSFFRMQCVFTRNEIKYCVRENLFRRKDLKFIKLQV